MTLRHRRPTGGARADAGSVTLEIAVLAPGLLALLTLGIAAGRYEVAAGSVEAASAAAARSASLARTPAAAQQAARSAAAESLAGDEAHCHDLAVSVDRNAFTHPAIPSGAVAGGPVEPAQIAVTVSCQVDFADLLVSGFPGTKTVTSRTASVLDTYRGTS